MRVIERCYCGGDVESVLSLGTSPPTCAMVPVGTRAAEQHYPLELLRCQNCTLVQLSVAVDPGVSFPATYPYSSGNSPALHENFADLASQIEVDCGDLVVDIGANDGTLLSKFDCRTVGVEPTRQARGIPTPFYQEFFNEDVARRILADHGPAKAITACNVLAHVDDIGSVMRGIDLLLAPGGVLVAENHHVRSVVQGQWDTIYHEHLRFFSPHSFCALLNRFGFGMQRFDLISTHGGSFRAIADRGVNQVHPPPRLDLDFRVLARRAVDARAAIREMARDCYGIGATARATTLINYCGLDVEDMACVCEVAGSDKIGHYIPGTRIPVVDERRLFEDQPPRALLLSWHLADAIVPALRERGYKGEIIAPLPTVRQL